MSRINDLIAELCPAGVPLLALRQVAGYSDTRIDANDLDRTTFVGVDNLLPNARGRSDAVYLPNTARLTRYEAGDVLLGNIRPYLKKVWLATNSGGSSGDVLVVRIAQDFRARLLPEFLYCLLSSDAFFAYNMKHAKGAKMPRGSKSAILEYSLPIPPLAVQSEIVNAVDTFTRLKADLEGELQAELEVRRRQHAHCRSVLLSFGSHLAGGAAEGSSTTWAPLADLVEFINGKPHERVVDSEGDVALMTSKFISTQGKSSRFVKRADVLTPAFVNDIALVMSDLPNGRALARAFFVDKNNCYAANQRVCLLRVAAPLEVLPRFLYYVVDRNHQLLEYDSGVDQTHLKKDWILQIRVPIPPVAEQKRIVDMLDAFDDLMKELSAALTEEIGARRRQYEYYRDRVLTFREAA